MNDLAQLIKYLARIVAMATAIAEFRATADKAAVLFRPFDELDVLVAAAHHIPNTPPPSSNSSSAVRRTSTRSNGPAQIARPCSRESIRQSQRTIRGAAKDRSSASS